MSAPQEAENGSHLSTCEFLAEELSALHAARCAESAAAGVIDGSSVAGLTCEMLEAEIRILTSQPPTPSYRHDDALRVAAASPRQHSAATRIQAAMRRWFAHDTPGLGLQTAATATPAVEQEVQRLTNVVDSYEREVLPQLVIERAVLNCELAKVRTDARNAAEASEKVKEALRDRVAEAEAESQLLRTQLASVRLSSRGGG